MNAPIEPLELWDRVTWYYPKPLGVRLLSPDQFKAVQILHGNNLLTTADARLLQAILTHDGELNGTQRFWLSRLARNHDERVAA